MEQIPHLSQVHKDVFFNVMCVTAFHVKMFSLGYPILLSEIIWLWKAFLKYFLGLTKPNLIQNWNKLNIRQTKPGWRVSKNNQKKSRTVKD